MRVLRGTAFQGENGWEKIEVELDSGDLLEEEASVEPHLQPLLLEVRADQQIVAFLERIGHLTPELAAEQSEALRDTRRRLFQANRKDKAAKNPPARLKSSLTR